MTVRDLARVLIAALVACLGLGLLTPTGQAAAVGPEAKTKAPRPSSQPGPLPASATADSEALAPATTRAADRKAADPQLSPQRGTKDALRRARVDIGPKSAAACNVSDFASKTGGALVQQIKDSETDCINSLFTVTGSDAKSLFREEQMVTVANALRDVAANYPGDNTTSAAQVVLYLRAGYYVQWGQADTVGDYGPALKSAIQGGLDTFFASPRAFDVTDANGATLSEAVILVDSAEENARFLNSVVKRLLNAYDSSYDSSWYMTAAVNNTFTVLFRGHQVPEFVSAVQADPSVLTLLRDFAVKHEKLLGTDKSYLVSNSGLELGRFLQHDAIRPAATPLVKELLARSSITGPTAPLWVALAGATYYYDKENCSTYGTCDLEKRLREAVLTVKHSCGPSLNIVAQQVSEAELAASCDSLLKQDAFFHGVVKDNGPVKDDNNTTLEVVVFDSSADYRTYAGIIFGIDTNNGGMYLEGDPSKAGNLPRFIAYEADWVRPEFQIWNLNHEYTHYLDGRYNMYGDFEAGMTTPTVMWVEGFAEYISYSYRDEVYEKAVAEAGKNTYRLSQLFDTTYQNADSTRVYQWGYLAVRYLIQSHPQDVATLLGHYRAGDWDAARTFLTSTIGNRYDADFADWLSRCAAGECGTAQL
ncbi:collagenase [Streptomyces sp. NPDC050504]|uniref:collagenase n=1 Tax=Streptomyces sp. NPDC050504 TaxID=3365618 RepID=UPI0037B18016